VHHVRVRAGALGELGGHGELGPDPGSAAGPHVPPHVKRSVYRAHKQEFAARLIEGAKALSTSLNDGCPADDARQAAITLIDSAMTGE
jgi:hypothetical protein